MALAIAIRRPQGPRICAVTVTGPASRMNPNRTRPVSSQELSILDAMREQIALLEAKLSY